MTTLDITLEADVLVRNSVKMSLENWYECGKYDVDSSTASNLVLKAGGE